MTAVIVVAVTDLIRRIRNRSALIVAIGAPVAMAGVFGLLLDGATGARFTVGVADADRSAISRQVVRTIVATGGDEAARGGEAGGRAGDRDGAVDAQGGESGEGAGGRVRFRTFDDGAELRHAVDSGDVDGGVLVPGGFGDDAAAGRKLTVVALRDPRHAIGGQVASAVAASVGNQVARVGLSVRVASQLTARPPGDLVDAAGDRGAAFRLDEGGDTSRSVDAAAFFGASMAIVFLFFGVAYAPRSLMKEKEDGTLARVLASPIAPGSLLVGKVIGVAVLGALGFGVVWWVTTAVFGAAWGPPVTVALLIVATVLSISGVSAFVCGLARTNEQADTYTSAVTFVLALLGGNFVGPANAPPLIQRLALLTPNGWALRGFTAAAVDGAGPHQVLGAVAVLLLVGAVFGAAGWVLVGKRVVQG